MAKNSGDTTITGSEFAAVGQPSAQTLAEAKAAAQAGLAALLNITRLQILNNEPVIAGIDSQTLTSAVAAVGIAPHTQSALLQTGFLRTPQTPDVTTGTSSYTKI